MTDGVVVSLNVLGGGSPGTARGNAPAVDQDLLDAGWVRRHSTEPSRAEEWLQLYRELGFETRTRALTLKEYHPACRECARHAVRSHVVIYTRECLAGSVRMPRSGPPPRTWS